MRIAFGWYGFKLKSFSAEDLDIKNDAENSTFEVRQQVFHIFWIPVFSLGKQYVIRRNNKLYDASDEIKYKILEKGKVRTPWYSFLLLILAIAIPIFVCIYIYVGEYFLRNKNYQIDKNLYENSVSKVEENLNNISLNAYLQIVNTEHYYDDKKVVLKLVKINGENFSFLAKKVNFPKSENEKYSFENLDIDTLHFTKDQIQKAICKDFEIIDKKKPYGVNFLGDGKYIISNIDYFDKPVITGNLDWEFWEVIKLNSFHYRSDFHPSGSKIVLEFQNFGISADLVEIKNIENKIDWTDKLPIHFSKYQFLKEYSITGIANSTADKLKFKSLFIFKDSLNGKHEFIVEGENVLFSVKRKD